MKKNESSVKKKHLLFIFISIVCYSLAYGDDVIVLTNSEQIQSKILEIRDKEIKYI